MSQLIYIALGGAVGASLRYGVGLFAVRLIGAGFPWGTLAVNALGSFVMGIAFVILSGEGSERAAAFWMTGVLGGFTTYSAFSLDWLKLVQSGAYGGATLYVAATLILALGGVTLGFLLAKGLSL